MSPNCSNCELLKTPASPTLVKADIRKVALQPNEGRKSTILPTALPNCYRTVPELVLMAWEVNSHVCP